MNNTKGILLATAAAALFVSNPLIAGDTHAPAAGMVKCGAVNACKGTSECKTATNECKGQNKCSAQGRIDMTKKDCEKKGGKVLE